MMKYLFSNPKAALLFVVGILVSTMLLVGSEEDEGLLVKAVDDVAEQRKGLNPAAPPVANGPRVEVDAPLERQNWDTFNSDPIAPSPVSDDGLVDRANGVDLSPSLPSPLDPNSDGESGRPVLTEVPQGDGPGDVIGILGPESGDPNVVDN